ncbi:MAG: thioredoxin domain-containing protein, partial [Acidobacteriota bacterium]
MKRTLFAATVLVLVLGFVLAATMLREKRSAELGALAEEQSTVFVRPHSPTLGDGDAKVVLVEFTDPACETCAAFSPLVKELMERHPGKIRLVVRYAPFHQGADEVARILEAARRQDRFWDTLDLLYRSQRTWTRHHQVILDQVWVVLALGNLDIERLQADLADPRHSEILAQDLADAETLGVRKTPGFFVNGQPLEPFGA